MSTNRLVVSAWLAGVTLGGMLVLGADVMADGDPADDQVAKFVPYSGTLEHDGTPVTGTISMTFSLYDGSSSDTAVWSETKTVSVYSGKFEAMLGSESSSSVAALTEVLTDADDVYLSIVIHDGSGDIVMANKQRFLPVPYAMWSTSATNFSVASALTVNGTALIESATDNDGTDAPLVVRSSDSQILLIDGDEIDSTSTLNINSNSLKTTTVHGKLTAQKAVELDDSLSVSAETYLQGSTVLTRSSDNALLNYSLIVGDDGGLANGSLTLDGLGINSHGGTLTINQGTTNKIQLYGETELKGTLDLKSVSRKTCTNTNSCTCSSGHVISGGVSCGSPLAITSSYAISETKWAGACDANGSAFPALQIAILCADIDLSAD